MRANPQLLSGLNKLWIRFFVLAVFATMHVRDKARPAFHAALGIDIEDYDREVFRVTTEISKQCFPVQIDIESPAFWQGLRALSRINLALAEAKGQGLAGRLRKFGLLARAGAIFARLYLLPARTSELPASSRLQPVW